MFSLRSRRPWAFSFLCWTLYGALNAVGSLTFLLSVGAKTTFSLIILYNLAHAYLWAAASPPLFALARRFSFDREHWRVTLAVHAIVSLALTSCIAGLLIGWRYIIGLVTPDIPFVADLVDVLFHNLPFCFAIMAVAHAVEYYARFRERQVESSRLETRLAQAQLEILRSQLDPHFLFNTLNSIATLTQKDPESAECMTLQLAALLRVSLDANGSQEVPLQQELRFLQSYLDIQQTRFRDRLTVHMTVDPEVHSVLVPSMILQPLVENAIRHGIAKSATPGCLLISASKDGDSVIIEIMDNGMGMESSAQSGLEGFGLRNTRARLEQIYGDRHLFRIESSPGAGCRVRLSLPIFTASASQEA
jgi:two-component system, LytTR family, sensor kinase